MYTYAWQWIGISKLVNEQAASPYSLDAYSGHPRVHLRPGVVALFSSDYIRTTILYWTSNFYFFKIIPNLAEVTSPLVAILEKDVVLICKKPQFVAIEKLKT